MEIGLPIATTNKLALEPLEDFVAVPIKLCYVVFSPAHSEVPVWQTVSGVKLFLEVFCSL